MRSSYAVKDYFNLPNPGLWSYLARVEAGNDVVYRPPFWKGQDPQSVLKAWKRIVDASNLKTKWPTLYDYELEMCSKVGPMSIQLPLDARLDDIQDYYTLGTTEGEPIADAAIQEVINEFKTIGRISLRSQTHTAQNMRLNTNSGNPYFVERRSVLSKTMPCTVTLNEMHLPGGSWKPAAVIGWRGQEGGPTDTDTKQRVVWMFNLATNICELQFYQPFIESVQKHNLIPAYVSMDAVDYAVTQLMDTKGDEDLIVCTDFSKFDQHFNTTLQTAAHQIFSHILDARDAKWLTDVFPIKYEIPLVCSDDIIFRGKHGMASGSGGTNADETVVHRALQYEAALNDGRDLNRFSQCLGDDGIVSYPGVTVEGVMETYSSHGLEMNADKQYANTQDCIYLRRWHHTEFRVNGNAVGVYPTFRALGRLLYQERFYDPDKWNARLVTLRAWSIIENCKYSPLFEPFVDFVMKGDKYKLGLLIPGFMDNIGREVHKAIDSFPDMLGYTKTLQRDNPGVKEWRIYQYLQKYRS